MKKLLLFLLLTPFFANSQVVNTILRKNTATKTIYSYSSGSAGNDTLANVYKLPEFTEGQVPAWDATNKRFIASTTSLSGIKTFVFSRDASDISGYEQAVALNSYVEGARDTATITATTGGVLMQEFATNVGFPNMTVIQEGEFRVYYESKKASGGQNYWTYAVVLKRNLAGTETVIDTTEISTVTSENTLQNVQVGFLVTSNISLLTTDRLVVKIYAQMQSSTASVDLYYDDATYARLTIPSSSVDATNFVPYVGATKDTDLGVFDLTADSLKVTGGLNTQFLKADGSLTTLSATSPIFYNSGVISSQAASELQSGYVNTSVQRFSGQKIFNNGLTTEGSVQIKDAFSISNLPTATPGTDSIVVHNNTTNTLSRLDPRYYVKTNGTDTIIGRKTFNDLIISREPTAFFLSSLGATTGGSGVEIANTGGQMRFGTEGSSGGIFFTGSSAYASVIGAVNNTPMEFFTNSVKRMTIANSGGVTLTGALTGTSATFNGTKLRLGADGTYGTTYSTIGFGGTSVNGDNRIFAGNDNVDDLYLAGGTGRGVTIWANGSSSNIARFTNNLITFTQALSGTSATFSGTITNTVGNNGTAFTATGATTGYSLFRMANTAGTLWMGVESNTGGTLVGGSTANSVLFGNVSNLPVQFFTNASVRLSLDGSTGAATFSSTVTATAFFESSSVAGKNIMQTNPLTNINPDVIQYTRKTDESKDVRYGYSAEQIHSLMPELTDKDVTAVKYLDVHTLLIAQLQQEIKELKSKLN